ncbi:MAG TPA: hypothetical protein VK447_03735, partial [Myxococcaceae bacterium]|nr:hypothetical protein [Myxococcaceae bacterium]
NRQFTGWEEERGVSYGLYRYVVRCVLIHIESGSTVGSGVGSASTMEGKYVDRPRESENTVLKMAKKRAFVDCTLSTFGLSDAFTQDLEDHASEADVEEGDAEVMASPAAIQAIRTEAVAGGATTGWLAWFDENTTGGATERWLGKAAADMREKLEQRRQRGRAGDLNERVRQAAAQPPHADLDRAGVTRDTPPPPDDEDDERASLAGSFDRFVLLIGDTKADARKPAADDAQRDRLLAIRIRVLVPRDAIASARLGELAHDPKLSGSQAKGLVNAGALAAAELGIALDAEPAAEDVAPPPAPGGLF